MPGNGDSRLNAGELECSRFMSVVAAAAELRVARAIATPTFEDPAIVDFNIESILWWLLSRCEVTSLGALGYLILDALTPRPDVTGLGGTSHR